MGKIGHRRKQRGGLDPLLALAGQIRQGAGQQRPTQAEPQGVDILGAGGLLDGGQGRKRPFGHVIFETFIGQFRPRIDPGNDENRIALVPRPGDQGIARFKIEDVKLVDPWRNDQQRPFVHLRGGRGVLDQFHHVVAKDHLTRGDGDILAHLERVVIGHADGKLALTPLDVGQQIVEALHQILAPRFQGCLQHLGIGHDEIGRR